MWQGVLGAKGILRARAGKEGCTYSSKTSQRVGQKAKRTEMKERMGVAMHFWSREAEVSKMHL